MARSQPFHKKATSRTPDGKMPGEATLELLKMAMNELKLSARAYDRTLKVARTIADLAGRSDSHRRISPKPSSIVLSTDSCGREGQQAARPACIGRSTHGRKIFELTPTQSAALVAAPVLLGSLARIPVGMLTDRLGGRLVFSALMSICAVPAFLVPMAGNFHQVIAVGFFLGLAGSSFAVGVGYVSRWTPPAKQGGVLGVYGLGNIGQSAAVFLGPVVAASVGWRSVYRGTAALLVAGAIAFALLARDPPQAKRPASVNQMLAVLGREKLSWLLALFYFLTFGGFVAFSLYLPLLLRDEFGLSIPDAGFRAAGFVVLATLLRPVGGWLSDRIGGARVLAGVLPGIGLFALLLAWPAMLPFTVGALGCAALLGLGNGAVFKLVPQFFPKETGTVGGLVGALGGLGGFFPPLLLGFFRQQLGAVWPGFVLLSATSLALWFMNRKVFLPRQETAELALPPEFTFMADRLRAGAWATMWTGILVAAIIV